MEKGFKSGKMVQNMMESGLMAKQMARVLFIISMEIYTRVILEMTELMAKEHTITRMAQNIKEVGKMT